MHPMALFPSCLVHTVRRYLMQRCHECGKFWVHYAQLAFHNKGVRSELRDVCTELIRKDHT